MSGASASRVRWRVLSLLVLASFISYVLRYNISTAGPTMLEDLGLSETELGYILAAFTAGYTLFQFPGGLFGVAVGPRRALTILMLVWAVVTAVTAAIPGPEVGGAAVTIAALVAVRFLVGVLHAPLYPLTGGVIERWFPVGGWALPNGLSSAGLTLGTAATATMLARMLGAYGWRASFLMLAPLGLLGAALWWWYVRDEASEHPAVNQEEVDLIHAHRAANSPPATATANAGSALRTLRDRNVLLLTVSYFCMNYVFYQMFNWVFYYLVTVRGFASDEAGLLTSTQWAAAAIGAAAGGLLCDALCRRYGLRRGCAWPAVAGVTASGLLLLAGSLSADGHVAVACLAGSFFANQLTEGAFWAAAISVGGRHAAAACGVMNTGGNAVGFVNALLVPYTAASLGWTAAMMTGTAFAFVSAALWLFIRADETLPD